MRQRSYYGILGVSPDATHSDIRSSYYSRARVIHPDRFDPVNQRKEWEKANEMLAELNEAYSVLRNPRRRSEYDVEMGYRKTAESNHSETTRAEEDPTQTESKQQHYQPPTPSPETHDEDSKEETTPDRGPAHVRFGGLPSEIKARLLDRQSGRGRHLAWRTKTLRTPVGFLIFAIGWTVAVFYLSNDYRWTGYQTVAYGGITIVSAVVCWLGAMGIWKWKQSPLKAYVFLTPLYFIKTAFEDIWYWRLGQLVDLVPVNHYKNGSYSHTTVTFIFDEGKESIGVQSVPLLEDLIEKLKTWGDQSRVAFQNRDWDYFVLHDDFLELQGQIPNHSPKPFRKSRWVIGLVAAVCVGTLVAFGAIRLNSYYDDKKSWDDATIINRVPAYRKYLETHPLGRWTAEAKLLIQQQYDLSANHYQASRSAGFDTNASGAILKALNYAKQTQHYVVRVAFERHNEIPSNIEWLLKDEFGVSNILSVGDSFSESKMQAREKDILSSVASAFREVIPEDILEFNDSGPSENNLVFLITYKIKGGKSLYYRHEDINIPLESRQFYPGIYVSWDFELRVPTESSPYRFSLESSPADQIRYQKSGYGSETETLYERMTESAFDDFRQELVKRMGLRPANVVSSTPTPTPTPDVSGEFSNEFGTLKIDHLGIKGFSFDINIGTGRCTGNVSGKAKWLKNGVAICRVIPDESEYANPESSYYQKTCQLTFKLSEAKVEVSQTQGCTYFHGAECAFTGSYER